MAAGALVQGSIGFGVNLVAAPILVLIDPEFVPFPVILASLALNLLLAARERGELPWRAVRWPMVGAFPACIGGAAAVAVLDRDALSIAFAVLVLVAVALSVSGLHPRHTALNLALAGAASGFMGTTTGIGGPPMGLVFQRQRGPQLRASLLRFFVFTSVMAIIPLSLFGEVHRADLGRTLVLLPGALVGYLVAPRFARVLDHGYVRHAVLAVSAVSAIIVLLRTLA